MPECDEVVPVGQWAKGGTGLVHQTTDDNDTWSGAYVANTELKIRVWDCDKPRNVTTWDLSSSTGPREPGWCILYLRRRSPRLGRSDGLAPVRTGSVWGYVNTTGKLTIEPRFHDVGSFQEGLARAEVSLGIASRSPPPKSIARYTPCAVMRQTRRVPNVRSATVMSASRGRSDGARRLCTGTPPYALSLRIRTPRRSSAAPRAHRDP